MIWFENFGVLCCYLTIFFSYFAVFRSISQYFAIFRSILQNFVSFRFVSFRFVSFRFVDFNKPRNEKLSNDVINLKRGTSNP